MLHLVIYLLMINCLVENVTEFLKTIMKLKPSSSKGTYVRSLFLSSTMGPGLQIAKEDFFASIK